MNQTQAIIRKATRLKNESLNIVTFPTHESYESNLCKTGHTFYAVRHERLKDWNTNYRPVPQNYILLDKDYAEHALPSWVDFDLVLSQNKFANYDIAKYIAAHYNIPLVTLEHCLPPSDWNQQQLESAKRFEGTCNIFISEYSANKWNLGFKNTQVIHHMVDTDVFKPNWESQEKRDNHILSVVNLWKDRDWCCNYNGWVRTIEGLPFKVVGDNPGLSNPSHSVDELATTYRTSKIFYNTSTISPVPSSLLEAMASGCACVSTATCMIPEIIENGVSGFISNDEKELREYLELLLYDDDLAMSLGMAAEERVKKLCGKERFVEQWNKVLYEACQ